MIKNYRELFKASQGTGFLFYKNAKDLLDRLEILMGQMIAGNDSFDIQNEAIAILDKLLRKKRFLKKIMRNSTKRYTVSEENIFLVFAH